MSLNLIVGVEQEDHDNEVRPMVLTRMAAGLTHSAIVNRGDIIGFSGLEVTINVVRHRHSHIKAIAPNTELYGSLDRPLDDTEILILKDHGFVDLGGHPIESDSHA